MRLSMLIYMVILAAVVLWCGGILLAPLCVAEGGSAAPVGRAFYQLYHPICHQMPERSFFLAGHPLGVCVRCSSLYFAFLAGTLLFPIVRLLAGRWNTPRWVLPVVLVPMLVDATWIGPWLSHGATLTRVITGGVFGLVVPFVLLPLALQAARELCSTDHQQKGFSDA